MASSRHRRVTELLGKVEQTGVDQLEKGNTVIATTKDGMTQTGTIFFFADSACLLSALVLELREVECFVDKIMHWILAKEDCRKFRNYFNIQPNEQKLIVFRFVPILKWCNVLADRSSRGFRWRRIKKGPFIVTRSSVKIPLPVSLLFFPWPNLRNFGGWGGGMFVPADMFYVFFFKFIYYFLLKHGQRLSVLYANTTMTDNVRLIVIFSQLIFHYRRFPWHMANQLYSFCLVSHCANSALWAIRRQRPKYKCLG